MRAEKAEQNKILSAAKKEIRSLEKVVSTLLLDLDTYRTARGYDDEGIESQINKALNKLAIKREDYFKSSFNGVNVQRIMDNSSTVFDDIKDILKDKKRNNVTNEAIEAKCNEYKKLFDLVDAALAYLHIRFPSQAEMTLTENAIKKAVEAAHDLGLSITPKWHLLAVHVFQQHKEFVTLNWGGLFIVDESFIEKAHQRNLKLQRLLRGMRVYKQRHITANKREHLARLPQVKKHSDKNRGIKKRKAPKSDEIRDKKQTKRSEVVGVGDNNN